MTIHLYAPALIVIGSSVLAFLAGIPIVAATVFRSGFLCAVGLFFSYGSPVALVIGIGMQIGKWA